MTDLTTQQQAILTEGICPLCNGEVHATDEPNFWLCERCKKGFRLAPDLEEKPWCYTQWTCQFCRHAQLSVHPAATHCLECSQCHQMNDMDALDL